MPIMGQYADSAILERRYVPKGAIIIRTGEEGNSAFLIQSGQVRVFIMQGDKKVELALLGPGQIFGEMALVFDERRTASIEATEETNLIVITRQTLEEKLRRSDPTIRAIVPMLMKRILQSNNSLLSHHADVRMLVDVVRNIYDIIISSLPRVQQKSFENAVLPKLDEFLEAVRNFEDKYSDK